VLANRAALVTAMFEGQHPLLLLPQQA